MLANGHTQSDAGSSSNSLDLPSLQPLSHAHPLLASDEYSADGFLLSRLHIPLEELRGELREYLAVLREELVQLINDDYEEFISLGTGLRGENSRLASLQAPLSALIDQVETVRGSLDAHQSEISAKLEARAELREERAMLSMINRMIETVTRAEQLWQTSNGGDRSKMVTRVAGEYNQVIYLARKAEAEHCKIVHTLEDRIAKMKTNISTELATLLLSSIEAGSAAQLKQILSTYRSIEGWEDAEAAVRMDFRQRCRRTITSDALARPGSPMVPLTPHPNGNPFDGARRLKTDSPLAGLLNRVLVDAESYRILIDAAAEESDEFDFYSRTLWPEISSAILDNLGGSIFAAGRPDELHQSYITVQEFISLFEDLAPNPHPLLEMRNSSAYESLDRRWQLPVYYQLRWKEIIAKFEADLGRSEKPSEWALSQSAAAWTAISTCWSENVFIPELASRFWRLSLQIVSRYRGLTRKMMEDAIPKDDEDAAGDDAALRLGAQIVADANRLSARLRSIDALGSEAADTEGVFAIDTDWYEERIIALLSRRCGEGLKLVRSVASQFRTSTATPSGTVKASYFITSILKPLHQLFDERPELRKPYASRWAGKVSDEVFGGYASILASVRKTEDLLRRHRKSKKTTFSLFGSSGPSAAEADAEGDRFRQQMLADAAALAEDVKSFGVDHGSLLGWAELQDVINRPAE